MPLKRKAIREEDTASLSGSEDDESSVDLSNSLRPRTRKRESDAKASPTPLSPALNTRRSSRLTAQSEKPKSKAQPETQPRTRLTRGLRRGSQVSSQQSSRGAGRGSRGRRGRGRPPKLGTTRDVSVARGTRKGTKRGDSSPESLSPSNTDTESTGDYDMVENDSVDQISNDEESEESANDDDNESDGSQSSDVEVVVDAGGSQNNVVNQDRDGDDDAEEEEEEAKSESTDSDNMKGSTPESEDESDSKGGSTPKIKGKPSTQKKGKRGRGPGRPKATEQASDGAGTNSYDDDDDEDLEIDDSNSVDFGGEDGGLGTPSQANLTRRQRAKLTRDYDEELLELPVEAKRSKFSAEEAALRKSEHARRRKFQSMQRAEQLKNDTINRLLNKQTSKGRNKVSEDADTRATSVDDEDDNDEVPDRIRYTQRVIASDESSGNDGDRGSDRIECALSLPKGTTVTDVLPCVTAKGFVPTYPPSAPACSIKGCGQKKKYSANSHAACSLEHWRILNAAAASASE
ncbi:INO80 complex subunit B [Coemansia sp. RSA 1933]|nr:INO80 complex subunit B [Coemansia sp. RSA 1933]